MSWTRSAAGSRSEESRCWLSELRFCEFKFSVPALCGNWRKLCVPLRPLRFNQSIRTAENAEGRRDEDASICRSSLLPDAGVNSLFVLA